MASAVQEKLKTGILDLQAALASVAQARQTIVASSLVLRRAGFVYEPISARQFESSRRNVIQTAGQLDDILEAIKENDRAAWLQMIGAFNQYAQQIPGVNISSVSVREVIELAVPPIPQAILVPSDSVEARAQIRTELAFYGMKPDSSLSGLGLLPAFLVPLFSTCGTAIAATAAATAGVGGIVVAVGCALGALALIATAVFLAYTALQVVGRLVDIMVPNAAASREDAKRLDKLKGVYEELERVTKGMSPADKARVVEAAMKNNIKPPTGGTSLPLMVGLGVAALAIVAIYILPKTRSNPVMAGVPRRRRSMRRR